MGRNVAAYKTLVRPHLEYSLQFWSPPNCKDYDCAERIPRRFTKILSRLEVFSYGERFNRLGLFSQEQKRVKCELMKVHKYK